MTLNETTQLISSTGQDTSILPYVLLFLAAMIIVIALVGMEYINYKKNKDKPDPKPDPVNKSLKFTLGVLLLVVILELLGIFEKGFVKKYYWVFLVCFLALFLFYNSKLKKRDPMAPEKLFKKALEYVENMSKGNEYIGSAFIDPVELFRVTQEGYNQEELRSAVVGLLVRRDTNNGLKPFFVQLNVYTGYLVHLQPNPPKLLTDRLLISAATTPKINSNDVYIGEEKQ